MYDKFGAKVIGFIDIGSVNNQLLEFEQQQGSSSPPVAPHAGVNGTWYFHAFRIPICSFSNHQIIRCYSFPDHMGGHRKIRVYRFKSYCLHC